MSAEDRRKIEIVLDRCLGCIRTTAESAEGCIAADLPVADWCSHCLLVSVLGEHHGAD
jgi:hypothetical protein